MEQTNTPTGVVFDIQRWSLHDGPGIRTNIFLKGCPLRCVWCANPESQDFNPQLAFFPDKCIGCRLCEKDCPYGAVRFEGGHTVDFTRCQARCGAKAPNAFACTRRCYAGAMEQMGREMTVDEVMAEALRDSSLYKRSGGGITFTGGEPLSQPAFLAALLGRVHSHGLHTTVETCADVPRENFEQVLADVDFLFVDIKVLDNAAHKTWMGSGNDRILDNCRWLNGACARQGATLVVRTPVVPGVTDSESAIGAIADFVRAEMPDVQVYQLLPYHRLGRGKYANIGRAYQMEDLQPPGDPQIEALNACVRERGLETRYE